jgi:hypothetical protein
MPASQIVSPHILSGYVGIRLVPRPHQRTSTLQLVVRYMYACFQVRARILNPCVGVPSNQPHLAGLM